MKPAKAFVIAVLCLMIVSQQTSLFAANPVAFASKPAPKIEDIKLHKNGLLMGQIVDQQGIGIAGVPVAIGQQGKKLADTKTNRAGYFQLTGLRGGMTQVAVGKQQKVYRTWSSLSAPKAAKDGVMVVVGEEKVVRGQMFAPSVATWVLPAAAIAGVATAIAVATSNNSTPASP